MKSNHIGDPDEVTSKEEQDHRLHFEHVPHDGPGPAVHIDKNLREVIAAAEQDREAELAALKRQAREEE